MSAKIAQPCSRITALTRRSFACRGNLVASSYTIGEMPDPKAPNGMQPGRVVDYVRNANLDTGIAYVSASGYTFSDNTRHEVDNEAWYQDERVRSKIRVKDGEVVGADKGIGTNMQGVYGGVAFGLDKFDVSRIAPRRAVAVTTPAAVAYAFAWVTVAVPELIVIA